MLMSLISWIILVVVAALLTAVVNHYVKSRSVSTKLLAVASNEFFENAEKLMKTPEDLPDSVVESLQMMSSTLNNGDGARALLESLRRVNTENDFGNQPSQLRMDVEAMRPELIEIFGKTVAGWLNFVTNRHFVLQKKIHIEMMRMAVKKQHSHIDEKDAGISALARFPVREAAC